ncbi:hypothetical protein Bca4012_083192 [Brassica carinata]
MHDWAAPLIASALFAFLSPGLILQFPGKESPVGFMNMKTTVASIFVHTVLYGIVAVRCWITIYTLIESKVALAIGTRGQELDDIELFRSSFPFFSLCFISRSLNSRADRGRSRVSNFLLVDVKVPQQLALKACMSRPV